MPSGLILVVEDDRDLCAFYRESLTVLGYIMVEANTGEEAANMLSMHRPRVLVLDVDLPGISGIEVCRRARRILGDGVPILFITSADKLAVLERCLDAGGDDFLVKTSGPTAILERITYWATAAKRSLNIAERNMALTQVRSAIELSDRVPERVVPASRVLDPPPMPVAPPPVAPTEDVAVHRVRRAVPPPPSPPVPPIPPPAPQRPKVPAAPKPRAPSRPPPVAVRGPINPATDPDVAAIRGFLARARRDVPRGFGREHDEERMVLLGYVTGCVNSRAKRSFAMKLRFLDYLHAVFHATVELDKDELDEAIHGILDLYRMETFQAAMRIGEADFDSLGEVNAIPRGLHDYVATGLLE